MYGRKLYRAMLIFMTLIAALGAWAMVDGAIQWKNRPCIEGNVSGYQQNAAIDPFGSEGFYEEDPYSAGRRG